MKKLTSKEIYNKLITQGIINAEGVVKMNLLNVEFCLSEKSAVGDLLQEWLKNWFITEDIFFRLNENTQEPPDFYLCDNNTEQLLEVKVFDYSKSPNFDVANFDTYIRSLLHSSYKINADYLIFGYELNAEKISIRKIWLKKIWEICRPSEKYPINTQVKQGKIVNIRPSKWYSSNTRYKTFKTKKQFLTALHKTIIQYKLLSDEINKKDWLKNVEVDYKNRTNTSLLN